MKKMLSGAIAVMAVTSIVCTVYYFIKRNSDSRLGELVGGDYDYEDEPDE